MLFVSWLTFHVLLESLETVRKKNNIFKWLVHQFRKRSINTLKMFKNKKAGLFHLNKLPNDYIKSSIDNTKKNYMSFRSRFAGEKSGTARLHPDFSPLRGFEMTLFCGSIFNWLAEQKIQSLIFLCKRPFWLFERSFFILKSNQFYLPIK